MSSYAYFATPTCRQATMQTYRVCKIAEDWKQQRSSALVKRQQKRSTTPLLSPVSCIVLCFNVQPSNYKLNTFVSWLAYKWACQSGRNCLLSIMFARKASIATKALSRLAFLSGRVVCSWNKYSKV